MAFLWIDSAAQISKNIIPPTANRKIKQIEGVSTVNSEKEFSNELDTELHKETPESNSARLAYEQASTILQTTRVNIIASDVMTSPVVSLRTPQKLSDAITFFVKHRFRHLPVVNDDGKLVGILSDRNLYKFYYEYTQTSNRGEPTVSEIARSPVLTADLNTPIRDIVRILFDQRIGAMPILDEDNSLTGIITRSDILRILLEKTRFDLFV